jgi:hypothetical protein
MQMREAVFEQKVEQIKGHRPAACPMVGLADRGHEAHVDESRSWLQGRIVSDLIRSAVDRPNSLDRLARLG